MISEKTIEEAVKRIAAKFHPQRIILFGSYARGTADEHSDVDFLVITPLADRNNRLDLMVEMDSVLEGLGLARDIVIFSPKEYETDKSIPGTVARYASKDGKLIYEHSQR